MIPQRIELWTYPYQEYALPIKLRNLNISGIYMYYNIINYNTTPRALRFELRNGSLKLPILPIKLCS